MAFDDRDRQWYYEQLQKEGYDTGSYDDFKKSMNNDEDREYYYKELNSLGYNTGSADDFRRSMRTRSIRVNGKSTEVSEDEYNDFMRRHPSGRNNENRTAGNAAVTVTTPKTPIQTQPQEQKTQAQQTADRKKEQAKQMTENVVGVSGNWRDQLKGTGFEVSNFSAPKVDLRSPMKKYNDARMQESILHNPLKTEDTGTFTTYVDSEGNVDHVQYEAPDGSFMKAQEEQRKMADAGHISGLQGDITALQEEISRLEQDPYVKAAKNASRMMLNNEQSKDLAEKSRKYGDAIASLKEKKQKLWEATKNERLALDNNIESVSDSIKVAFDEEIARRGGQITRQYMSNYNPERSKNERLLGEAKWLIDDAIKLRDAAEADVNGGNFFSGALRGLSDSVFDISTWDEGAYQLLLNTDLNKIAEMYEDGQQGGMQIDQGTINRGVAKLRAGKQVTREEELLMKAKMLNLVAHGMFDKNLGKGYKSGKTTGESLGIMIEFLINPMSGETKTLTSSLGKILPKGIAVNIGKRAMKGGVLGTATRVAARNMAIAGRAAAVTATTGSLRVAGGTFEKMTGELDSTFDENGNIAYAGRQDREGVVEALGKSFVDQLIENGTEMGMGVLGEAGRGFKWVAKNSKPAQVFGKWASGTNAYRKVKSFVDGLTPTEFVRMVSDFERKAQWHGTFAEYWEEVEGSVMRSLINAVGGNISNDNFGTDENGGLFNLQNNIDTFLGVALMGGAMSTLKTLGYRSTKNEAAAKMNSAIDEGKRVFGEKTWAFLQEDLDEIPVDMKDSKGISAITAYIIENMQNGTFTQEGAKAVFDYLHAREFAKGSKSTQVNANIENDKSISEAVGQAEAEGEVIDTPEEIHEVGIEHSEAEDALAGETPLSNGTKALIEKCVNNGTQEDFSTIMEGIEEGEKPEAIKYIIDRLMEVEQLDGRLSAFMRTLDDDELDKANNYMTAKAKSNGTVKAVQDGVDEAVKAERERMSQFAIDSFNLLSGEMEVILYPAAIGEEKGYIRHSEGDSVIFYPEDGSEPRPVKKDSPSLQIGESMKLDDYMANYEQNLRAQKTAELENAVQHNAKTNLNPQVGDVVATNNGNMRVAGVAEDGSLYMEPNEVVKDEQTGEMVPKSKGTYTDEDKVSVDELVRMQDEVHDAADAEAKAAAEPTTAPAEEPAEEPTTPEPTTAPEGEGVTAPAETAEEGQAAPNVAQDGTEPMPMTAEGDVDFAAAGAERTIDYLYNDDATKMPKEYADQYVDGMIADAQKTSDKAQRNTAKFDKNPATFKANVDAVDADKKAAKDALDFWKNVKETRQRQQLNAQIAQQEEARKQQEALTAQAQADEAARQAEVLAKQAELAERGANAVHPAIADKWNAASKVEGAEDEITLANGEVVKGKYMVVESGAATPSHDAMNGFVPSEGFPVDENGQSVNDRDYERDTDAQTYTRNVAAAYDARALQTPVVVSKDGVVLSGNGRTMAGEIAAAEGTDNAYVNYLREHAAKYGIKPEDIEGMQHPRLVFTPDADMPYTAETFAKFNAQEMKGQSKAEQAVKLGKTVDDNTFGRILSTINNYDRLGDFYADTNAASSVINELMKAGVISEAQMAEMYDGDTISSAGKELLENMLIGKAFETNPDAVRMITAYKSMRQSVVSALSEIVNNVKLGEDYSLQQELADAVSLVYEARNKGGFNAGDKVSQYARQGNLFAFDEGRATVADMNNATMLIVADMLNNSKVTALKNYIKDYNVAAQQSAAGQMDLFAGGVLTKEDILSDALNTIGYEKGNDQGRAEVGNEVNAGNESNEGNSEAGNVSEQVVQQKEPINGDEHYDGEVTYDKSEPDNGGIVKITFNQYRQTKSGRVGRVSSHGGETIQISDLVLEDEEEFKENLESELKDGGTLRLVEIRTDGNQYFAKVSINGTDYDGIKIKPQTVAKILSNIDYRNDTHKLETAGGNVDKQGNPIDADGKLIVDNVESLDGIADEDFLSPTKNIAIPNIPEGTQNAIGAEGRPVIIKRNVFKKNKDTHPEISPATGRDILSSALYNPTLVGTTQPIRRPDYKVVIQTGDKNSVVVLDVFRGKDNVEIVGWRRIDAKGLENMKRQAAREDGQFLILSPDNGSAAALSALPDGLSSEGKGSESSANMQANEEKNAEAEGKNAETAKPAEEPTTVPERENVTNLSDGGKKAADSDKDETLSSYDPVKRAEQLSERDNKAKENIDDAVKNAASYEHPAEMTKLRELANEWMSLWTNENAELQDDVDRRSEEIGKEVKQLISTLSDDELETSMEFFQEDGGEEPFAYTEEYESRQNTKAGNRMREQEESQKHTLSSIAEAAKKCREAYNTGDNKTMKSSLAELEKQMRSFNHQWVYNLIEAAKRNAKECPAGSADKKFWNAIKKSAETISQDFIDNVNKELAKAGYEGVELRAGGGIPGALWLEAKQGSKYHDLINKSPNSGRWFDQRNWQVVGTYNEIDPLTMDNTQVYVDAVKKRLEEIAYELEYDNEAEVIRDADGNPVAVKLDNKSTIEFNIRTWGEEKEQIRQMLIDGDMEEEEADAIIRQADMIAESLKALQRKYPIFREFNERPATGRPILRDTGEYISWDYSFNCVKKDAMNSVMDMLVAEGKAGHLGITQIEAIKNILQRHDFLTPCVMCYVEAKRKVLKQSKEAEARWNAVADAAGLGETIMGEERELTKEQTEILTELANGKGLNRVDGHVGDKDSSEDTIFADTIKKEARMILDNPILRGKMDYRWMVSPSAYTRMYDTFGNTPLMNFLTQGQYKGKGLLEVSPFSLKSIPADLRLEMYNPIKLKNIGGMRQFSYEDARAILFFDYYTQFTLMEGARASEHLYTKRPFMPAMFGKTGVMMNQSLIVDIFNGAEWHRNALGLNEAEYDRWLSENAGFVPKGALDKTLSGEAAMELVPNWSVESFPVDEAMANVHNKDFKGTVGNVYVAPSRKAIIWALNNPEIHMILPYHAQGANPIMKSLTGYDKAEAFDSGYHTIGTDNKAVVNYNDDESGVTIIDKVLQWDKLLRRCNYNAKAAAKVYLDLCEKNGWKPMFNYEGIVDHPEYYKVLTNFRMYDEDGNSIRQKAVKMVLPDNWKEVLDKYLGEENKSAVRIAGISNDSAVMEEIRKATKYTSMEPVERETTIKVLENIYGKDNVEIQDRETFDKGLDSVMEESKVQLLRDNGGMVYGYAIGEKIVLNDYVFNANTPMHEHTHIYMKVLKAMNPRLYSKGMELWRDTQLWNDAKAGLEELGETPTDDQIFSECMSQFTGGENEEIISKITGVTDKNWLNKVYSWFKEMWSNIKSAFSRWTDKELSNLTAEEFAQMPLKAIYDPVERAKFKEALGKYKKAKGDKAEASAELMSDGEILYSNAERAVESINQNKATGEQWINMLKKNGGLKAEEDKWMGLSEWLKDKKSVTKDDVLKYIAENDIKVEEKFYSENGRYTESQLQEGFFESRDGVYLNRYEPKIKVNELRNGEYEVWLDDKLVSIADSYYDALDEACAAAIKADEGKEDGNPINGTRLEYTTQGLTNKREIALTVPNIEPYNRTDEVHFGDAGEGRAVAWLRFGDAKELNAEYVKAKKAVEDFGKEMMAKYGADQFDAVDKLNPEERNIYESLISDLKKAEANKSEGKVLVIDEIQSKRHQDGRENGYRNDDVLNQKKAELEVRQRAYFDADNAWREYRRKLGFGATTAEERLEAFKKSKTEEHSKRLAELEATRQKALDSLNEIQTQLGAFNDGKGLVPDAPFRSTWHELAMKRALRYAAENGYDKVAWTTGDQQAERYNLGGKVDFMQKGNDYGKDEDTYFISVNGKVGDVEVFEDGIVTDASSMFRQAIGKPLSDLVGKELAERLTNTKPGKEGRIQGEGLSIGGEGMKGFYDQMIPRFIDKYGKKWGVKSGTVELDLPRQADRTMHSVDVTPEMKKSVMSGQARFSRKKPAELDPKGLSNEGKAVVEIYSNRRLVEARNNITESIRTAAYLLGRNTGGHPDGWQVVMEPLTRIADSSWQQGWRNDKGWVYSQDYAKTVWNQIEGPLENYRNALVNMASKYKEFSPAWRVYNAAIRDVEYAMDFYRELASGHDVITDKKGAWQLPRFARESYPNISEENSAYFSHTMSEKADMEAAANTLGREMHVNIEVVRSAEEADKILGMSTGEKQILKKEGRAVFLPESGRVIVFLPNLEDVGDLTTAILHEVAGHKGLRQLVGSEHYDRLLAKVYQSLPEEAKAQVNENAEKEYGGDRMEALDEMLAEQAEKNETPTWWGKVKAVLRNWLRELGFDIKLSDNDIKYMLWQSKNKVSDYDPVSRAEQAKMRDKLGIARTKTDKIRQTAGEGGVRYAKVTDEKRKQWFDKQEKVTTYKTVSQMDDNTMRAPMASELTATKSEGEGKKQRIATGGYEFLTLLEAEENPSLIQEIKDGRNDKSKAGKYRTQLMESLKAKYPDRDLDHYGKIMIIRDDGKQTNVAYDSYDHSSDSLMNDQFKSAWERDNLIVIEQEIAQSDLDEQYLAEGAYLPTGKHPWKSGAVGRHLPENEMRHVYLARWSRPKGIVPVEKVAQEWIDKCTKYDIEVPFNVVPKAIRNMIAEAGVKIVAPEKGMGKNCFDAYEKWVMEEGPLDPNDPVKRAEQLKAREAKAMSDMSIEETADRMISAGSSLANAIRKGIEEFAKTHLNTKLHYEIASKLFEMKHGVKSIVADENTTREDLIRKGMTEAGADEIMKKINSGNNKSLAAYVSGDGNIVIFAQRKRTISEMTESLYHESVHKYLHEVLTEDEYNKLVWNIWKQLSTKNKDIVAHVKKKYNSDDWLEEFAAYIIGSNVMGKDNFDVLSGASQDVLNAVTEIANFIEYGKRKQLKQTLGAAQEVHALGTPAEREERIRRGQQSGRGNVRIRESEGADSGEYRQWGAGSEQRTGEGVPQNKTESRREGEAQVQAGASGGVRLRTEEPLDPYDPVRRAEQLAEAFGAEVLRRANEKRQQIAEENDARKDERNNQMYLLGDGLRNIRKAMTLQRHYDEDAVKAVTDYVREFAKMGVFDSLTVGKLSRLLAAVKNGVGKEDIRKQLEIVADIAIDQHLKMIEERLDKLVKTKTMDVDNSGVQVQGKVGLQAQRKVKAFRTGVKMPLDGEGSIAERLSTLLDKIDSTSDDALKMEYQDEYDGLMLASEYQNEVKRLETEMTGLKNEKKDADEDYKQSNIGRNEHGDIVEAIKIAMRENKLDRIDAIAKIAGKMQAVLEKGVWDAAEFDREKREHAAEIRHYANSDMQGRSASQHRKTDSGIAERIANSDIPRLLLQPLATFDTILRRLGNRSPQGKGYLFNHFMRGWIDARDSEIEGFMNACEELDNKAAEVMGKKKMLWSDLYKEERKKANIEVSYFDGSGEKVTKTLTQGNALYIYMVNKMLDGAMKLRKMGISEEDVKAIEDQLDPRFLELADWVQDEFLVKQRNKYNAVHQKMFGAPMAAIENYFPLRINKTSLNQEKDVSEANMTEYMPSTKTGAVVKRTRNTMALDILNTDAFSVVIEHLQEMEHWAAFAQFNQDLSTLLSYSRFKNQVMNMATAMGAGNHLWNQLVAVSQLAAGSYKAQGKDSKGIDRAIVNLSKGVTASKIAFRVYTALKQTLSGPAAFENATPDEVFKAWVNSRGSWNWCYNNLPIFKERVKSRIAGDTRLMASDSDWNLWKNEMVKAASRVGMAPNAFIDALTCAVVAKSAYETSLKRYIKDGYDTDLARKRAMQDAELSYNESQQSSESAFVNNMQVDRTVASTILTVFRNSSMAYTRKYYLALDDLKARMKPGQYEADFERMKKQYMRDGLSEEDAEKAAKKSRRRSFMKAAITIGIYRFALQALWNLAPSVPYLILGDDDEEKKNVMKKAAVKALLGAGIEGLAAGNFFSDLANAEFGSDDEQELADRIQTLNLPEMPVTSDLKNLIAVLSYDKAQGYYELARMGMSLFSGVDPSSMSDAIYAIVDATDGNLPLSQEITLAMMKMAQVPNASTERYYFEQMMNEDGTLDAKKVRDFADRYIKNRQNKTLPLINEFLDEETKEKRDERFEKQFNKKLKKYLGEDADGLRKYSKEVLKNTPALFDLATEEDLRQGYEISKLKEELKKLDKALKYYNSIEDSEGRENYMKKHEEEFKTKKEIENLKDFEENLQHDYEAGDIKEDSVMPMIRSRRSEILKR